MAVMSNKKYWLRAILILLVGLLLVLVARGAFVGESQAVRALKAEGFSEVQIVNKDIWLVSLRGCGDGDAAKFDAKGINPAGKPSEVYVCVGCPFKGATIRHY